MRKQPLQMNGSFIGSLREDNKKLQGSSHLKKFIMVIATTQQNSVKPKTIKMDKRAQESAWIKVGGGATSVDQQVVFAAASTSLNGKLLVLSTAPQINGLCGTQLKKKIDILMID